ncbi:unnamed protein product [Coffea canephora]|uniref:DDT domain-containing protein n=2 Tax=Coffea TaxID=13442 RepID=A0A068U3Q6_COFCA|nr:unnamed protein product [Coffea canephora]
MAITSTSSPQPDRSVSAKKNKIKSPNSKVDYENKSHKKLSKKGLSSPAKRNNNPGIRLIHGRIYDSHNGKTCHQCRQKTRDFAAECKNMKKDKLCPIKFCHKCLLNRYGEKAEEVGVLQDWSCPKCRGICNCSQCMKKRGHLPTGILVRAAKQNGFSSVSAMLQLKGPMTCYEEKSVKGIDALPRKRAAPNKMEVMTSSPRKQGKENAFDGKINSNSCASPLASNQVEKKSKKVKVEPSNEMNNGSAHGHVEANDLATKPMKFQGKREEKYGLDDGSLQKEASCMGGEKKPKKMAVEGSNGKQDGNILKDGTIKEPINPEEKKLKKLKQDKLKEMHNGNKNDNAFVRRTSPRSHQISNGTSKKVAKSKNDSDSPEMMQCDAKVSVQGFAESTNKKERKAEDVIGSEVLASDDRKNNNHHGTHAGTVLETLHIDTKDQRFQNSDMDSGIVLPHGTELTSVHDIQIPPEDVGKALQFLEFCAVFGKVLGVKKEQPECVLRDLIYGRSSRRGKYSVTVQFLIKLLSVIRKDRGQTCLPLSPTYGQNSWINALTECISESGSISKSLDLNGLDKGANGYENLNSSKKLIILNLLCDEVLGTLKIRNWMENQVSKAAEIAKEDKERVLAAKDKEKRLKQKIQDEIAKAIIEKNGDLLSVSEHDAVISKIKREAARAHSELLESIGLQSKNNQSSDAVRTEPVYLGTNGHAYWRLKCLSNKSDILLQDVGTGDTSASDEKWFGFEEEQKEVLERRINSLRGKRLRAKRVPLQQQSQSNGNFP